MIAAALEFLKFNIYDYLIVHFMFCCNGFINATGHTLYTAVNNILCSVIIRVPVAYLLSNVFEMGLAGVGCGTPVSTVFGIIIAYSFYFSGKWKNAPETSG